LIEFEAFLTRNDVRFPAVQIVKDGQNVALNSYARELRIGSYVSDGLIDMDLVAEAYRQKGTVVAQLLQNSFPSLAEFAQELSSFILGKVDVHAFLTPSNAQGLSAHYDTASAFLIQLRGAKRWRLYEMQIEAPTSEQTFSDSIPVRGEPIADITLTPGDVLYIPRGLPHSGLTFDKESLHLTVVLFPKSWIDIFSSLLEECQKEEDFRKAPFEFTLFGETNVKTAKQWRTLVERFLASGIESGIPQKARVSQIISPASRRSRWHGTLK